MRNISAGIRKKITHIYKTLQQIYREFYLTWQNRFSSKKLSEASEVSTEIIVSLTTHPLRIHLVYLSIETMFCQEVLPHVVHLWLSLEEFPEKKIPDSLGRLAKRGLKISFVEENLRSHQKLVYAVEAYPNSIIVTIDDDVQYSCNWLKKLLETHKKYPEDIICYRGHYLELESPQKIKPYEELMDDYGKGGTEASFNLLPTGISGVLYPPHSLSIEINDRQKCMALAPTADDIWFKCCTLLNNRKSRRVFDKNIYFSTTRRSQTKALYRMNVNQGKNDEQLEKSFSEFNLYHLLIER